MDSKLQLYENKLRILEQKSISPIVFAKQQQRKELVEFSGSQTGRKLNYHLPLLSQATKTKVAILWQQAKFEPQLRMQLESWEDAKTRPALKRQPQKLIEEILGPKSLNLECYFQYVLILTNLLLQVEKLRNNDFTHFLRMGPN